MSDCPYCNLPSPAAGAATQVMRAGRIWHAECWDNYKRGVARATVMAPATAVAEATAEIDPGSVTTGEFYEPEAEVTIVQAEPAPAAETPEQAKMRRRAERAAKKAESK